MSPSRRQSRMMLRCRCTALVSIDTTLFNVLRATYLRGKVILWDGIRESERVDLPNVIISIAKEFPEDVNSHHAKTAVCLNIKYSQDRLV